jgi:hypothetical protein
MLVLALAGCAPTSGRGLTAQVAAAQPAPVVIPVSQLEAQYGLHVNLIAVTAAGGMVDLRLKVLDAAKAGQLLKDRASMPVLFVADGGVTLKPSDETAEGELSLKDGQIGFTLFPNTGNAVKAGTPVSLVFGDMQVEPIIAQ